jgi:opacity protein-like surface antigen
VTGNDFATLAAGATVKLTDNLTAAAAYEFPVMARRDLFDNRFYLQMSLKY